MKTLSERHATVPVRCPAALRDAPHGVAEIASPHARDVAQRLRIDSAFGASAQRMVEGDDGVQMKTEGAVQREDDEDEPLQGRLCTAQRQGEEEEEPLQARADSGHLPAPLSAARPGGLRPSLRRGVEAPSGMDRSDRDAASTGALVDNAPAQLMPSGGETVQLNGGKEFGRYDKAGKRKRDRVVRMEEFGDRHRVHNLEPTKVRESLEGDAASGITNDDVDKEVGIWRPSEAEGTARPEDPPIYQPFRKAFHEAHSVSLALTTKNQYAWASYYGEELLVIASRVKDLSRDYKKGVRALGTGKSVEALKGEYFAALDKETKELKVLTERMLDDYVDGDEELAESKEELKEDLQREGDAYWREQWWGAIQRVNTILTREWPPARSAIQSWVKGKHQEGLRYMDPGMVGELDYIGSLAKGYKSAPKQYIRFMPEKFDVDANLDAPPLAVYLIQQHETVDRGSVHGAKKIPPIEDFQTAVWALLREVPGVDAHDPFEVYIRADDVDQLLAGNDPNVLAAQAESSLSARIQLLNDRLWRLRINKGPSGDAAIQDKLAAYLTEDKTRLKSRAEFDYKETDVRKLELRLRALER